MTMKPARCLVGTAVAALLLAGCTGGGDTDGEETTGSTGTTTETQGTEGEPELVDRSDEILGFTMDQDPIAQTTGTWVERVTRSQVTLQIYAVEAHPTGTRLTYGLFPTDSSGFPSGSQRYWADFPRIVDNANETALLVNRFDRSDERETWGVHSLMFGSRTDFAPMTAHYPPLQEGVSEVDIETSGLDTLTVPVTWPSRG